MNDGHVIYLGALGILIIACAYAPPSDPGYLLFTFPAIWAWLRFYRRAQ